MTQRALSRLDQLIIGIDRVVRTLADTPGEERRPSPARDLPKSELDDAERRHAAGLMRVNHSGEVCAQALYQGQALTAKLPQVRAEMEHAAEEEIDHLVWCRQRLDDLNSHTSYLNPLWYGLSFALGSGAGLVSDRVSLGFVAATEERVCQHLQTHLEQLPETDRQSRAVVQQMLTDEAKHAQTALAAGGLDFPAPVKTAMSLVARAMTASSYRL
ncbi:MULTISPECIES: 2-polyprenyl-3-methyl-6-methoxy-1,4-benzoquinone monooxygenase [unclassified Marinimicrobium]|mgnify:FL=1|jgi:ubiquinone biosynthesis monooxygenase Coq7|uniref:2-polyprenyl-3-methyl-6-methoxy-1,4-benzoquinone monooxygenase n=1 Tax=unclassified Marinimicrobium TaxID=2632100 RepID=UPI000C5FD941|nr:MULTISPECIES: 2-polyprenyl-3-methyl-6-methoxy-1,4-benzoquinone monooxygenase [unclassified Marinimicrobium]MAN51719.1 demethoxyubiquinone hydroxylase family protein [Marinimicrobium sp.]|tara:strand:+ start:773 stop:1417 length:645 start_codon:yes stop_codon:yes gene_type:complete